MASSSKSASASVSTSASDGKNWYQYDVFINHRGPDVKKTFASHLYHSLTKHGVKVFLDKEELQKGDENWCQIKDAIRVASVHIALFSPTYAHSNWCLDELLLMLESMGESRSTIIPIFFGVKPSKLRWTEGEDGEYAQALRTLQNKRTADSQPRYDSNTIKKWKKALHDVADLNGFELEAYNHDEGQLLADVVQLVLEKIPKPPLYVSKYPTGLDGKVRDFEEKVLLQQHESGEARVVGIVGLGGVGKTTLAKEIFNRERINYRSFCFLSDVREKASSGSLNSLQSRLLEDLAQLKGVQINNTDEGIEKLRKHLCSSQKAFIILDDVDHIDQLEALISSAKDVLSSSSLIIVTSRNKDVVTSWGIGDLLIYKLEGLNREQSRELFCWHAFRKPQPVAEFEQVLNELLKPCNGLPLSLKVIGSLLFGKNLEYWKAQLRKISKILPDDIQKTLKISYDSLDEEEKYIFLDIACFFIGETKDTAIRIWDGSGWEGSLGLQNLQNKCLVEVCDVLHYEVGSLQVDHIRMHDHLRDLGRYLADKKSLRRIWHVTEDLSDQSPVRGIKTSAERDSLVTQLRNQNFRSYVDSVFSVGQSPQLTMLRWYNCPYSSLPSEISRDNLRILYITGTNLEEPWHLESQAPLQLRELYICASKLQKIPESIGQLKHLEKIVLVGGRLKTLPEEFCQLPSLKHLELDYGLESLPDSFGNLTSLQHVKLGHSSLELLPDSFGNLTKLQHIDLSQCQKLTISSETLGNITTLEYLNLYGCKNIKVLPPQLTHQPFLQEMILVSDFKELPSAIGNLSNLKILTLESSCLEMLPPSFGDLRSLEKLVLSDCSLKCFPDSIRMLPQLKSLSIWSIENLEKLEMKECPSREVTFKEVGGEVETAIDWRGRGVLSKVDASKAVFPNLQHLQIGYCDHLVEVGGLPTTLQTLDICQCTKLEELPSMETLVSLEVLSTGGCCELKRIHGLAQLTKLKELDVVGCSELEELPGVEHSRSLKEVDAVGCPKLKREYETLHRNCKYIFY